MSKKYHVQERVFLNNFLEMPGFAVGIVEDSREIPIEQENAWKWSEVTLVLGDCVRSVSFTFDLSSNEERENSLFKINKIVEIVTAVRNAVEIEARSKADRESIAQHANASAAVH